MDSVTEICIFWTKYNKSSAISNTKQQRLAICILIKLLDGISNQPLMYRKCMNMSYGIYGFLSHFISFYSSVLPPWCSWVPITCSHGLRPVLQNHQALVEAKRGHHYRHYLVQFKESLRGVVEWVADRIRQIPKGKTSWFTQGDKARPRRSVDYPTFLHCLGPGFLDFFLDSTPGHSVKHSHPAFRKDGIVCRGRAKARANTLRHVCTGTGTMCWTFHLRAWQYLNSGTYVWLLESSIKGGLFLNKNFPNIAPFIDLAIPMSSVFLTSLSGSHSNGYQANSGRPINFDITETKDVSTDSRSKKTLGGW